MPTESPESTILQAREELMLSQQDLADALGVSQQFIAQVENGERPFPQDRVEDLFRVLAEFREQRRHDLATFRELIDTIPDHVVDAEVRRIRRERRERRQGAA